MIDKKFFVNQYQLILEKLIHIFINKNTINFFQIFFILNYSTESQLIKNFDFVINIIL